MRRAVTVPVLFAFLLSFAGPAIAYKKIDALMPRAPEKPIAGATRIAVVPFRATTTPAQAAGKYISGRFLELLLDENRVVRGSSLLGGIFGGGKGKLYIEGLSTRVFSPIERAQLDDVLRELKIGDSGLVDDAQALEVGKLSSAQIVVYGDITVNESPVETGSKERIILGKGKSLQSFQKRSVELVVQMRAAATESAEIMAVKPLSVKKEDTSWERNPPLKDANALALECAKELADDFVNVVSPFYATEEFEFEEMDSKQIRKEADKAAEKAEDGDLDEAYSIFQALLERDPYNPKLRYNIGLICEAVGNFEEALGMYESAKSLSDEDRYRKAIERMEGRFATVAYFESVGLAIRDHSWGPETADEVTTKGDGTERWPVRREPREDAEALVEVPGGISLPIVEVLDGWYKVELQLTGDVGYLQATHCK